jgi:hypothetical protein
MKIQSFYNQPAVLQRGDKIAFDKKRYLYVLYHRIVLISTGRVKEGELEHTLFFNSLGSKEQCKDDIYTLKWVKYNPKKFI